MSAEKSRYNLSTPKANKQKLLTYEILLIHVELHKVASYFEKIIHDYQNLSGEDFSELSRLYFE